MQITNLTETITIHQDGYAVIITPTDPAKAQDVAGFKWLMEVKILSTNKNVSTIGSGGSFETTIAARLKTNGGK